MEAFQNFEPEKPHQDSQSLLQPLLTEPMGSYATVLTEPEISPSTIGTPDTTNLNVEEEHKQEKNYGGIRRTGYFLGMFGVAVINAIFNVAARDEPAVEFFGFIITVTASFILVVSRLHNIGISGW
ncbi:MAG TPA: hypothetical protein PKY88_03600 [Anaerohalosphaeraceae bacterium]|nr:hypothetical protein [Anaerohalosphaeraceae bacterium]